MQNRRNQKINQKTLDQLPPEEKEIIIEAIKKTVRSYMADGFSYGYSCATAARQSKIQKGVVLAEVAKDRAMLALRDEFNNEKRKKKKNFILGVKASEFALKMYKDFE